MSYITTRNSIWTQLSGNEDKRTKNDKRTNIDWGNVGTKFEGNFVNIGDGFNEYAT